MKTQIACFIIARLLIIMYKCVWDTTATQSNYRKRRLNGLLCKTLIIKVRTWQDIYKMLANESECRQRNGKCLLWSKYFISLPSNFTLQMSSPKYQNPVTADSLFPI